MIKKKKIIESQKKEYIEYLSKAKQEKNTVNLPKLVDFSCEEAFKTALEDNNIKPNTFENKIMNNQENTMQVPFYEGIETCVLDDDKKKDTIRLKQEQYRNDLSKQIEEKKRLEQERKHKELLEDEAIDKMAKDQEDRIRKEFEKEVEKRTLAQLQKQLQQEKLKNEMIQKQKELDAAEKISHQVSNHVPSCHELLEEKEEHIEEFHSFPQSNFDNVPLPTSRVRVQRKIDYNDEVETVNKNTRDMSCNTDTFQNPRMNHISPPAIKKKFEKAHVTFVRDSPLKINKHNSTALLPGTKSIIIDSPYTLALAGLDDYEDEDNTRDTIEPTEATYKNQKFNDKELLKNKLPTDKHLLSNLGNIRKQLDIEHQKLKQQVRRSQ